MYGTLIPVCSCFFISHFLTRLINLIASFSNSVIGFLLASPISIVKLKMESFFLINSLCLVTDFRFPLESIETFNNVDCFL